jgi:Domain of unknown function (DUF5658)
MIDDRSRCQRSQSDRRARPTSVLDAFRLAGRRSWPRRQDERAGGFFVDRFHSSTLALVVTLLALTIADGVLTLELLSLHSEEANPFMGYLLHRGPLVFLFGKYLLTAIGLPVIVVCKNHPMFGTRFRVGFLLPVFIGLYVILITYQLALFHAASGDVQIDPSETVRLAGPRVFHPMLHAGRRHGGGAMR